MKRIICALAIILIIIIIGLHNLGVVFFEYDKVYLLDKKEITFYAIVLEMKSENEYKRTYVIKIIKNKLKDNILSNDKQNIEILENKKFLLEVKIKENNQKLEYGDIIEFKGIYNKPSKQRNYGGFDYSLYLKTQKIYGTFESSNITVISNNKGNFISKGIQVLKKYIKAVLEANLEQNEAELCSGLIIGDKSNLDEQIEENFKTANLTHMLAISGSHFSYIILALSYINKLLKRKRLGQILTIIIILVFMNLTGNTGSVVRAGIMAVLGILSSMFYRKADVWTNMAIAIIIQIFINPYIIFDIGVQLSYMGTIGIILFSSFFMKILKNGNIIKKYIIEAISITVSANIVIIPIMMLNFNTISLSFVISNILAGAILGIIIILAFALVLLSIIFKNIIAPIFLILNTLLKLLIFIANICSLIPFSKIYVATPNIILVIFFYIIIFLIYKKIKDKNCLKIKNNTTIVLCLILVILLNFTFPIISSKRKNLEVNFIDVGQGDSTLIRVNNKNILIDGGGSSYSNDYDVGKNILLPYLLDRGVNKIDYVIVSHFDSDHCQGLNYILENIKVKNAIISKLGQESSEYDTFINLCKNKKINLIFVKKGDNIKIGNASIDIIFPDNIKIEDNEKNNNALVFKFSWKDLSILFTGDIEEKAENKILNLYEKDLELLKSTILKVAHHGSKTSSSRSFLKAVEPKIALIGVGEDNNFGHPNKGVLERLESISCRIYRTDESGEITIKYNKELKILPKIE